MGNSDRLKSSSAKMLRIPTRAIRPTKMPPPPLPMDLSSEPTLRQEDFWTDVNSFLNDADNGEHAVSCPITSLCLVTHSANVFPVAEPYFLSLGAPQVSTPLPPAYRAVRNPPLTNDWAELMNFIEEGSDPVVSPFDPTQPANASLANTQSGSSVDSHYPSHALRNPLDDSSWLTYPPTTTQPDYHPRPSTLASEAFYRPYTALPNAPRLAVSLNTNAP